MDKDVWFKYSLDRSTPHPKCDPTGVRTHDLKIMNIRKSFLFLPMVQIASK